LSLITLFIFCGFFLILAFLLINGLKSKKTQDELAISELTILIPFKNEMTVLPTFVERLKKVVLNSKVEIWLLNDHSTDITRQNIEALNLNGRIFLYNSDHGITGKKAVLNAAIKRVKTEWLLLMDADAEPPNIIFAGSTFAISKDAKCVLIPLRPKKSKGLVSGFFDLDFISLHFAGLASANGGKPLLANAACMLINRQAYLESLSNRKDWNEPSGDDIFAMFAISKAFGPKSIAVLNSESDFVNVTFPTGISAFWAQRLRWISKTGKVASSWFQIVAWCVLLTQILFLICMFQILTLKVEKFTVIAAGVLILLEIAYLIMASARLKRRDLWIYILPAIFIYPFYLLALVIFSTFAKPKWK